MRSLVALTAVVLSATGANAQGWDRTQIDKQLAVAIERWMVPGAVIAVVHEKNEYATGAGVQQLGNAKTPTADTLVPLASCTKAVTTTVLAMLVAEKKLSWDDPVRKHLPDFHLSDAKLEEQITIRDLVSHRSGIRGHDFLWYHAPWNRDEIVRRIGKLPVDRPFRENFEYSTLMVMVAGKVTEKVAGKSWDKLVAERIAEPLQMTSVLFTTSDPRFATADRMHGYRRDKVGKLIAMPTYETREPNAAGSIHLSARDLLPWLRFQLANEDLLKETRKPSIAIPMTPPQQRLNPETKSMSYAMGWLTYDYRGQDVVAHGGMIDGFRVQVTLFPKHKLGIAIVNNLHDTKMNQALTNNLADSLLGLPAKDWNAILLEAVRKNDAERVAEEQAARKDRRKDVPPSVPLGDFVGKYHDEAYGDAEVTLMKGKLVWKWSSFTVELDHWEADTFRFTTGIHEDKLLPFRVGKNGPDAFRFEGQIFTRKN